jgi:hypothetical protein
MAINLKDLYDVYFGDVAYLSPVKGNTPFEYYTNDPEFIRDAKNTAKFVAQRLGISGPLYNPATGQYVASPAQLNISDLTVYASFEESVTTYGNMVYQYKIRDNYINIEGSDSLPFNNSAITFVNSEDISSPVTWSIPRLATWAEVEYNPAYSQSIVDGEIYAVSASLSDFIALDQKQIKSLTFATEYVDPVTRTTLDLSTYVYNQFNKIGGRTSGSGAVGNPFIITSVGNYVYTYVTSPQIAGGSAVFGVTGSIPTVYIQDSNSPSLNNRLISNNLANLTTTIADNYAAEAEVGGHYDVKTGSLLMKAGIQDYDLNVWAAASASLSGSGDKIEIRRIFYEQSPAIARYFDPYAGTGTGIQSLLESFGFGQMSPGINFLLMPISFDAMKLQAIELNDQIRKSGYSFNLVNNKLKIFPIPSMDNTPLFFEYVTLSNKFDVVQNKRDNIVTDIMNVPYRNPIYSKINTVGRAWIYRYTLALCREIEAHVRIQFANLSIGGVGSLQGSELVADARTEKQTLIDELKEMLNETSRKGQLERKQLEAGFTRDTLQQIPLPIYIM